MNEAICESSIGFNDTLAFVPPVNIRFLATVDWSSCPSGVINVFLRRIAG